MQFLQEHIQASRRDHHNEAALPRVTDVDQTDVLRVALQPPTSEPSRTELQTTASTLSRGNGRQGMKRAKRAPFILRIRPWFLNTVYTVATVKATNGWDISLRTYNIVPVDAEIFEACEYGDLSQVRRLFAEGRASPLDRDAYGQSLLWVCRSW